MTIVAVTSGSITQILIKNHIINNFSIVQAGYWQSVWMISTMYLLIITTAFSTYYLPRLSELHIHSELRKEIMAGYKVILPFVFIAASSIYLLRDIIIVILFTPEFNSMRNLFAYQLIGDFFKMASWSLAFLMIAKAKIKLYIITEITFSISLYILTIVFVNIYGLVGVTHAYALNNFFYLITMSIIFKDIIFTKK
jgi:PST family polysaccharide transporter